MLVAQLVACLTGDEAAVCRIYYTSANGSNDYCNYMEIAQGCTLGELKARIVDCLDIGSDYNVIFKDAFGVVVRGLGIYALAGNADFYGDANVDRAIRSLIEAGREISPGSIDACLRDNTAGAQGVESDLVGLTVRNLTRYEVRVSMKVRSSGQNGYVGTTRQFKMALKPRQADGSPSGYFCEPHATEGQGYTITM